MCVNGGKPTAVQDVGAAVDFILQRRRVSKIDLMGWSWGTTIMGLYTTQNNYKVNRLVLYAASWISTTPPLGATADKLGAYRTVTREAAKKNRMQLFEAVQQFLDESFTPGQYSRECVTFEVRWVGVAVKRFTLPVSEANDLPASDLPLYLS
jgi:pimeloyl-ACP methyl ester carboxylesterase